MLNLFQEYDASRNFPTQAPSSMDYILRSYQRDVTEIVHYYRRGIRAIDHQHLLCRIIGVIGAPNHYPMQSYMNVVDARYIPTSKTMRLTSAVNYGTVHYGVFGAPDDPEIIIVTDEPFNMAYDYKLNDAWMRIQAVKCIQHQNSCMVPYRLDGQRHNSAVGLRVYQIDIRKLMFQFKFFVEQQMNKVAQGMDSGTSVLDKTHFVAKYVLPNMMYSDMDLQLINRFQNIVTGRPMDRGHHSLSVPYIDYTEKVDRALTSIKDNLVNARRSYESYLRAIPTLFKDNAHQALQVPDAPPMRQVMWAIMASRVKQIRMLMELGGEEGRKANRTMINSVRLDLKAMINDNQFSSVLDRFYSSMSFETVYDELMTDIRYIGVAR